jgi:hypothetical protein
MLMIAAIAIAAKPAIINGVPTSWMNILEF